MKAIRESLFGELSDAVRSLEVNPHTGSVLIHHNNDELFPERLMQAMLRVGLQIVTDEDVEIDGVADNRLSIALLCTATSAAQWGIEKFGLCTIGQIFSVVRVMLHLQRIFAGGRLNEKALAVTALDYLSDIFFGFVRSALSVPAP